MPLGPLTPRAKLLLPLGLVALVGLSLHRLSITPQPSGAPGAASVAAAGAGGSEAPPARPTLAFTGRSMGTTYNVKLVPPAGVGVQRAQAAVQAALDAVEASMSTYRDDSELSKWNAARSTEPIPVSDALHDVAEVAIAVGRASGGALDVTIAPLVDAWGFGPSEPAPPSETELATLMQRVGLDKLDLDDRGLRKMHPELRCDLSAVAKGYAVDRASRALAELGAADYLVEVGGELRVRGRRADGEPWRVAIEKPIEGARAIERVLRLTDAGLATSGDYRNYYEKDGKRVSHLLDPRTGRPIEHGLASVSVVHARVVVADAWATALSVLGPEKGPAVAEREGLSALFLVRRGDGGFRTIVTPAFARAFPQ